MPKLGKPTRVLLAALALAGAAGAADTERGTVIREATMYVYPDVTSQKVGTATRGRDIPLISERSTIGGKAWARVLATVDTSLEEPREISGWIESRSLITTATPNADQIIYGEAVDSERQAEQRGGRRHAAEDAMRLYYRLYEYFPNSPLAGEGLYRAADIRWQIDKADVMSRPSAREKEAYLREGMNEDSMRLVIKKFPGTKWADLAAFHLIENKLCGDWQASSKCPLKEAEMYEKYAEEHPHSPTVAEALYNAAWRLSALIEIYKTENQPKKSEESKAKALALAQKVSTQFPQSDWGARAERLVFLIVQGVPTYGNAQP